MTDENKNIQSDKTKNNKTYKGGLIRWSAVVPFGIFVLVMGLFFTLFFDSMIKSALEWTGYKATGAEVNIASFKSSFLNGNVSISGIQMTDAENPEYNTIEIGSIRFDVNWNALLKLKFVVEEMAAENIQLMSKRSRRGKVAPPEPPKNNDEPSLISKLQDQALDKIKDKNKDNLLGDVSSFLQTGDFKEQLKSIESQMLSKQMADDLKNKWQSKQIEWDNKIKELPKESDFKIIKTKFDTIKVKDFKNPQELESAIKQINELKKDVDDKIKSIDQTKKFFTNDLESLKKDYEQLDKQVKEDIAKIKERMKIPKISADQIAKSMFMDYLSPYISKLNRINELAKKYLPAKYSTILAEKTDPSKILSGKKTIKSTHAQESDAIVPHPRDVGTTYEFPIAQGYPLFWIQKIKVSTKANEQINYGNINGQILNIVSNQKQIGKPTVLNIQGDIKPQNISGLKIDATLNNLGNDPEANIKLIIASLKLNSIDLIKSDSGTISIPTPDLSVDVKAETVGFKNYIIDINNNFNDVKFDVLAQEKNLNEILKSSFSQINSFSLNAKAEGALNDLNLKINSSLGEKLEKALSNSVQQKIDELNKQIQDKIDSVITLQKLELQKQINSLTKGYLGDATNAELKLNSQKAIADEKINQAKKDAENKAKKQIQQEGQKALDDLKKKFGF